MRLPSALTCLIALVACSPSKSHDSAGSAPTSSGSTSIAQLRGQFPRVSVVAAPQAESVAVIPRGDAVGFSREPNALRPRFRGHSDTSVLLPNRANGGLTLSREGGDITIRHIGASDAHAVTDDDAVLFDGAYPSGTLVHVPSVHGVEELVRFTAPPKRPELRERVDMHGIVSLRRVANVLEFLGPGGDPVFRTRAPFIVDAKGNGRHGSIDVEDCAVDTSGRPPWDRPMVAPGSDTCTVRFSWSDADLAYPILVDPPWVDALDMVMNRAYHTAAPFTHPTYSACTSGCVLAVGGTGSGTSAGSEMYSVSKKLWTVVADMPAAPFRRNSASVSLGGGRVLVAGGVNPTAGAATIRDAYIFDPGDATAWKPAGELPGGGRQGFTLRLLNVRKGATTQTLVIGAGGNTSFTWGPTGAVDILDVATTTWTAGKPAPTPVGAPAVEMWARDCSPAPCTGSWSVLLAGGYSGSGFTKSVQVYDSSADNWSSLALAFAPIWGTAALTDTQVLLAGGLDDISGTYITDILAIPRKDPSTLTKLSSILSAGRDVLVGVGFGVSGENAAFIGGRTGVSNTAVDRAEFISPSGSVYPTTMTSARYFHQAVVLPDGSVMAVGGLAQASPSPMFVGSERLALSPAGSACSLNSTCLSLFCVDGVCCNTSCTDQCVSCNVAGKVGTCSPVTGAPVGGRTACDGFGTTCGSSCNGVTTTKCTYAASTTICTARSCASGVETQPSYCTGSGACATAATKDCGAYVCGASACKTSCTSSSTDCATGYGCKDGACVTTGGLGTICTDDTQCSSAHCTPSDKDGVRVCCESAACADGLLCASASAGADAGKCSKAKKGAACTAASGCATGFCVDGVCCDGICAGQCEACDVKGAEGTCVGVAGAPHGARTACSDGGGSTCKALACDGAKDRTKCAVFANGLDKECAPASCTNAVATDAATCDGSGGCRTPTQKSCAPFACGDNFCRTSCASESDCSTGNVCTAGACVPAQSTCSSDGLSSQPADKSAPKSCAPFRCNPSSGDCYATCTSSEQCTGGAVCDGTNCVPAATEDSGSSGGCQTGHGTGGEAMLLLALVAMFARVRHHQSKTGSC